MRSSLGRRVIVLLLAQSLFLTITFGQQQSREETRPRRTQQSWPSPAAATPVIATPNITPIAGPEPTIRVALTTSARSAMISTTGHLMNASGGSSKLLALDSSRVRVNPRMLSPSPVNNDDSLYSVVIGGAASREEAE